MKPQNHSNSFLSKLGPGLLYAGAAIGVSHLVQSTRAGGMFGFDLLIAIVIIHIIKYPFFEFGARYTSATGRNILHGYKKLGEWAVWIYLLMTLATMFIIQAAVTIVTAGLFTHIFGFEELGGHESQVVDAIISSLILIICFTLLASGRYILLDKLIKVVIVILSVTTVAAVIALLFNNPGHYSSGNLHLDFTNAVHLIFIASFLGFMPAPLELSVWHSSWCESKIEAEGKPISMKDALFDYRVGYIGTAILAMCFLTIGALVMYGSDVELETDGTAFAEQLLDMYRQSLGDWAYPIVAIAALTTMFSTTLTLLDAFPRTISISLECISPQKFQHKKNNSTYLLWLLITITGTVSLLFFFTPSMGEMVKIATVIAFVGAPVLATLNTLAMFDKSIPEEYRPGKGMLIWCLVGLAALISCSVGYLFLL